MSWTEVFPVLSGEMTDAFEAQASGAERKRYDNWFGISSIFPPQKERKGAGTIAERTKDSGQKRRGNVRHIVSATFFWKHVMGTDPELPTPTKERLVMAKRLGLVKRFSPWESYVEPLVRWTPRAVERHPEVEFRLYLASDLDFLIPELTALGWEIHLMRSPSVRFCPGAFWRFLVLEENALVTLIDTDRMNVVDGEIARTELMHKMRLGLWRVPGYYEVDNDRAVDRIRYRPLLAGHFGARGGLPVRQLIDAFVWHTERGTMPALAKVPGRGEVPIHYVKWPDYGLDEWFLLAALYPRLVRGGTLSFIPTDARSFLLPLDIEYVTWANRRSEIMYF